MALAKASLLLAVIGLAATSGSQAQLSLVIDSAPRFNGSLPTLVGLAGQTMTSSLLQNGAAVMLYGVVPSVAIEGLCRNLNTQNPTLAVNISSTNGAWGHGSWEATLTVDSLNGCGEATGVQLMLTDLHERKTVVDCPPPTSTSSDCDVWWTGDDIEQIWANSSVLVAGGDTSLLKSLELGCTAGGSSIVVQAGNYFSQEICNAGALPYLSSFYQAACGIAIAAPQTLVVGVTVTTASAAVLGCEGDPSGVDFCECKEHCCNNCFPGDATVQLEDGTMLAMQDLSLGDKVATWGKNGELVYDFVYAFGHKDSAAMTPFVKLTVGTAEDQDFTRTLELSGGHFVQTAAGVDAPLVYKRAMDVTVDDYVWALQKDSTVETTPYVVKGVSTAWKSGLYNPITMSGSIVVDGVVASVHSDWFLDAAFDFVGMTAWLPVAYQTVLAPARMLVYTLGEEKYISLYTFLDGMLGGLDKFGTNYGASITGAGTITSAAFMGACVLAFKKSKQA